MESFKFVVDPNKNCAEQFKNFLKIDIITVIQYYYLRKLLSDNNINTCDTCYIRKIQFKLHKCFKLDSPMFYTSFNKYVDLYVREDNGYKYYVSLDELIDKFKEILLTDKFNDIINNHVINEYNALYTHTNHQYEHLGREQKDLISIINYMYVFNNNSLKIDSMRWGDNDIFRLKLEHCDTSFIPVIYHDSCILSLVNEYTNHVINNGNNIDNTMSDNIVYTSDLEVTKQVLRNNQKIIANIVKNLKNETSDSNKQKLMQLLTSEEIKPEVKPKQRTKITL